MFQVPLLGPLVAVALSLSEATPAKAPSLPKYVHDVTARWDQLDIQVKVRAVKCGYDNAWYDSGTVTLCTELFDRPTLTRFILNHELAHAYFDQHGVPMVLGKGEEFAADELAVMLSFDDEVVAGAQWFLNNPGGGSKDQVHPSSLDRAAMLLCLLDGFEANPVSRQCKVYARSAFENWQRVVALTL